MHICMVDVETEHSDAQNACITHHRIGMERTAAEKKPLKLQRWAIRFFFKMFLPFLPSFRSHLFSLSYRSVVRAQAQAICWPLGSHAHTHTLCPAQTPKWMTIKMMAIIINSLECNFRFFFRLMKPLNHTQTHKICYLNTIDCKEKNWVKMCLFSVPTRNWSPIDDDIGLKCSYQR